MEVKEIEFLSYLKMAFSNTVFLWLLPDNLDYNIIVFRTDR